MRNEEIYEDLLSIIGETEFNVDRLEMMIKNGHHERANRYLEEAVQELRHALSDMSDADFHVSVSSDDEWL